MKSRRVSAYLVALAVSAAFAAPATAAPGPAEVQSGLERLVAAPGGPPGAIATMYRGGKMTVLRAGRADIKRPQLPRASDHMRIASVAKAFSGAVALNLVRDGRLGLDDTIAQRLGGMPVAWGAVTVRQMLNHTSGLPDYTQSKGFAKQARVDPRGFVSPSKIIGWVRADPLEFASGSRYEYSNTDNIVIGLIVEAITGRSYGEALEEIVFGPAKLSQTSFPTKPALPRPFIHGYVVEPGEEDVDVSTFLSPSGAWASGAIVSTPRDLNAFIRSYLGLRFFSAAQQQEQMRFVPGGESSPPGPGQNSAGLALFRYKTKCGTVYGHTGNFPGYVQWAAATADGSRAVTTSLNIPAPSGKLLAQLRRVQTTAVCALLSK
ncbi:MAG TPA: serine hydrolase domain-containing protein [Solirubrobacterales bacterium]|nr:serine hydrolase domain-containing protein [Solirubrobacterales bacterium]